MRWIILILMILILANISLADKLKTNENMVVSNSNLTLNGVSPNSIKIDVDGQGAILNEFETKIVNGLEIEVLEIFYVGDDEINYADISASSIYICGDDKCDDVEKNNCCSDCGCKSGYECSNEQCKLIIIPECKEDVDCDDKDSITEDTCKKKKCYHQFFCIKTSQCEDNEECTKDYCEDGTCFNEDISGCGVQEEIEVVEEVEVVEEIKEEPQQIKEEIKEEVKDQTKEVIQEKTNFLSKVKNFFKKLVTGRLFTG